MRLGFPLAQQRIVLGVFRQEGHSLTVVKCCGGGEIAAFGHRATLLQPDRKQPRHPGGAWTSWLEIYSGSLEVILLLALKRY